MAGWVAERLGENRKALQKAVAKAQALVDQVDGGETTTNASAKPAASKEYTGRTLETLPLVLAKAVMKGAELHLQIPEFLRDVGVEILKHVESVGLFRLTANRKRVDEASDQIESGASLKDIPNLQPADLVQLMKEWVSGLSESLIPACLTRYFLRTLEPDCADQLSPFQTNQIMKYLTQAIPFRAREILMYLSYVLAEVARNSEKNLMTPSNLATVCPTLFTGRSQSKVPNVKEFECQKRLMEYIIRQPWTFVLESDEPVVGPSCSFLPSGVRSVAFTAPSKAHSPKVRARAFTRSPVQSIRSFGHSMVDGFQKWTARRTTRTAPKNRPSPYPLAATHHVMPPPPPVPPLPLPEIEHVRVPYVIPVSPAAATPPYRERLPSRLRMSTSSATSTPRTFGDVEMLGLSDPESPLKTAPIRLDFEEQPVAKPEPTPCERCLKFALWELDSLGKKAGVKVKDASVQTDFHATDQEQRPEASQNLLTFAPIGLRNKNPSPHSNRPHLADISRTSNISRRQSMAAVIPNGIVAQQANRLKCMGLGNSTLPEQLEPESDRLD
ncbi:hypothetical protein BV898_10719 [Hypsibius exemplaris]|uniref:Rho-GAP domain-containing protein n=1 Tax=Hypsibius exemplaris TaxID=2072580 RepID=A0A1W0WIV0_HYPEX|nr:hypothetical protein BV898_10719 [Hypsibius exemplaris]